MSIIIFHNSGSRELVACGLTNAEAVEVRSELMYHRRTDGENATLVTDEVAASIFPQAATVRAHA